MQNEQGIPKLPYTALQRGILREESRKIKSDSDRSIFYPENPVHCPSVSSYLSQRALKRYSLLTAVLPWKLFSKLFSLYCHAKQILPRFQSLQGGQGGGELQDGLCCAAFPSYTLCPLNKHTLVLQFAAKFKHHSSESQQMITLNKLNSKQSTHFLSKMFFRSIWKASSLFLSTWDTEFYVGAEGF